MTEKILPYKIGGLLYMPAFQKNIVEKLQRDALPCLTSIAFCLEDSIQWNALETAEKFLRKTFDELKILADDKKKLPLIFIRVRSPQHLKSLNENFCDDFLTGYIFPKFDLTNAEYYLKVFYEINSQNKNKKFFMPILETEQIANILTRKSTLFELKNLLDDAKNFIPNIRVGVNDFCNLYGLRRDIRQTIYDIGIVRDTLTDILNVFAKDYVVAGSVWNFFNGKNSLWREGLKRELELDKSNGFIGKSAIHPSQLPIIFESLKVSRTDFNDAENLLNWSNENLGVEKSSDGSRMNEVNCHRKWAEKIKILSELYGIED